MTLLNSKNEVYLVFSSKMVQIRVNKFYYLVFSSKMVQIWVKEFYYLVFSSKMVHTRVVEVETRYKTTLFLVPNKVLYLVQPYL